MPRQHDWNLLINWRGQTITFAELFGEKPIRPGPMAKTLWAYIHRHQLARRRRPRLKLVGRPTPASAATATPTDPIDDVRSFANGDHAHEHE